MLRIAEKLGFQKGHWLKSVKELNISFFAPPPATNLFFRVFSSGSDQRERQIPTTYRRSIYQSRSYEPEPVNSLILLFAFFILFVPFQFLSPKWRLENAGFGAEPQLKIAAQGHP